MVPGRWKTWPKGRGAAKNIEVNRVAYGKQHHLKIRGMPCFDVNTKLGTEDGKRAGEAITKISTASSNKADIDAYEKEMDMHGLIKPCHGTLCAVLAHTLRVTGRRWALVPGVHAVLASNQ
ncbi:hypothetical protein DPMN_051478 [Dreissena polymorpha]|uniref:Uncharacterized protein n=1 Tax=Dreissena polymorpha TaxID=45954 RepID=A0A9D4CJV0_DREPO|nr:hypothetical protein DPMN_051478 [Dreissena polymorpha]